MQEKFEKWLADNNQSLRQARILNTIVNDLKK